MKRRSVLLLALLGAGVLALVIFFALPTSQPPTVPLPNPNGYDVFVKAGGAITPDLSDYPNLGQDALRMALLKNADALNLARTGFTQECRVPPMDYAAATTGSHLNDLSDLKRLGQAFAGEGWLAELENRPTAAAAAYLDAVRLGYGLGQGGLMIDAMVGIAIEAIGTAQLEKLATNLDAKQCREAARVLEAAEARRERAETVLQRDRLWVRHAYGFRGEIVRLFNIKSEQQLEQKFIARRRIQETRAKALMIELAVRAYELEHGARPKALADLVPDYLKVIPQDPSTGTNMAYLPR